MDKKVLRWNYVFQYGWVLTNVFNSILLLPLYVKNIDASTLGIWLATNSVLAWMTLVDPGVGEVLQQKIAALRGSKQINEIGNLIGSGFVASAIILLISIIVGLICYFSIGAIINKDISQYPHVSMALLLSIIATGMLLVSFTMSGINQGMHNSSHVAISSLSANFLFLGVNLTFLYMGMGVISIAFANLCRALFINVYNIIAMKKAMKKENIEMIFDKQYFKKFIKIFSFTSASKIITGVASGMDMIVLARFIAPSMITIYEINKRPINFASTFIGRHSVALMPSISHAKGSGEDASIKNLIKKQFKFYCYASIYASFVFILSYKNLITIWVGKDKYAGNTIMYLLVINSFLTLVAYFMSNVQYALGDIKKNSSFNIVRNLIYAVMIFFAARYYGIIGTLAVSVSMMFIADFFYFTYKVFKLGYVEINFLKGTLFKWLVIIPLSLLFGYGFNSLLSNMLSPDMIFAQIIITTVAFSIFFILMLLMMDADLRSNIKLFRNKILFNPIFKKL